MADNDYLRKACKKHDGIVEILLHYCADMDVLAMMERIESNPLMQAVRFGLFLSFWLLLYYFCNEMHDVIASARQSLNELDNLIKEE